MKKNHSEIILVVDRSYSIRGANMEGAMREGFNGFIADQKKEPGTADVTTVLFADVYDFLYEQTNLVDVKPLTKYNYEADGRSTALWDATGRTIVEAKKRFKNMKKSELPEHVIFVIMTDGEENSSEEFKGDDIKTLIAEQEKDHAWKFVFLGASKDPFAEAKKMGICASRTVKFDASAIGTQEAYSTLNNSTKSMRSGGDGLEELIKNWPGSE